LTEILVFPMGGAIARVPGEAAAFGDRSARWAVWVAIQWTDPAEDAIHRDWTRGFSASLAPWTTGSVYVNAIGGDVTEVRKLAAFGGSSKYERLRELKRTPRISSTSTPTSRRQRAKSRPNRRMTFAPRVGH
jgi:hypothetical protein